MKRFFITLIFLCAAPLVWAQDFMMQGWYWDYPKTAQGANWADTLRLKAPELGQAGINMLWIPPHVKASSGNWSNGYDPRDLYDLGQHGPTGMGSRSDYDDMVDAFEANGILTVADMVYNHRDGGAPEYNPSAEGWIKNFSNPNNHPYPSDRFRAVLPIGGSTGRGAGDYYISIRSATGHSNFQGKPYTLYLFTDRVGWQNQANGNEQEPNNGAGQFATVTLGRNFDANVDAGGGIDEFKITLSESDFNASGDKLYIIISNKNGDYSDHFIWNGDPSRNAGLWYDNGTSGTDVANALQYETYTDFTNMPSGMGAMNYTNFKPNGNPTNLGGYPGDWGWDHMVFFYDYDQFIPDTKNKLFEWTSWNWTNAGVRGLRVDAIKHFTPEFMGDLLDYMHDQGQDPPMVVGEWYGYNVGELTGWVNDVLNTMDNDTKAAISPRIFDFVLRENLRQACDAFGYDVRNLFNNSLNANGLSGFNIVTFANNHDFRDENGQTALIKNDPILAYAYLLTNNQLGIPCIFYPDYYGTYDPANFNYHPSGIPVLKGEMDQLMAAHKIYINGANSAIYLNNFGSAYLADANYISGFANTTLLYQLNGANAGRKVIVAINFAGETLKLDHKVDAAVGTQFTDLLGRSAFPTGTVDGQNRLYFEVPPRSYSVWVEGSVQALPPTELQLTAINPSGAALSWRDNSGNETAFVIERKTGSSGTWAEIATTNEGENSYTDASISPDTDYIYRVRARNAEGDSEPSNEVNARLSSTVTSVEPRLAQRVSIEPNPNMGTFRLNISGFSGQGELELIDREGRSHFRQRLQNQAQNLDLSHLPKGLYFLKISLNGQQTTKRLIIQ